MQIEQMNDIELDQLKKDIESDDNIVAFGLFYDRSRKKMYFVKHGDEGVIDKMVRRAACNVQGFAATISKIAFLWNKNSEGDRGKNPFGYGDNTKNVFNDLFGKFRK